MPVDSSMPSAALPHRIGLGTAQFGLDYGLTSAGAPVGEDEVARILELAREAGVIVLDTAALYGTSEVVVGRALKRIGARDHFRIVTKLASVGGAASAREAVDRLEAALSQSQGRLDCEQLYGVILHVPDDLASPHAAAIVERMAQWRASGRVRRIGSTIYDPEHIQRAITCGALDLVQLPVSILDQRLVASGHLAQLDRAGFEVHARSALLQGLLLMSPDTLPPQLADARRALVRLHEAAAAARATVLDTAIGFVTSLSEVDHVILGVHSRAHLAECLAAAAKGIRIPAAGALGLDDPDIIDPRRWRRAS